MKCPFCGRANVIEVMTRFERGPGNATVQAVRYCDNCGTVFGEEKRHIDAILAERDGYRAVAEQRAAEVERLAQEVERQDGFRTEVEARLADIESRLELATERNGRLTAEVARLRGELSERETTIRILSQSDVNRFKEVARLREAYDQLLEAGQQFHGEHLTGILDGRQCAHADEDSLNVFGSALVELEDLTPLTCDCGKGE